MKVDQVLALLAPISFIVMVIIERLWPARRFPEVPYWHAIGVVCFIYTELMNALLPEILPTDWLVRHRLMDLSKLGVLQSVVVGHLAITFVTYGWHRATHAWTLLWRGFHQLHHAPCHLNIYAANMVHPTDLLMYVALPTLTALFVLGLDPFAAALVGNLAVFSSFFQHWNVNTPQWVGYIAQRPESHCIHHQRDVHSFNYSDFPLWDILFGTFRNPKNWTGETGFDPPTDINYGAMLAFVDVNKSMARKPI